MNILPVRVKKLLYLFSFVILSILSICIFFYIFGFFPGFVNLPLNLPPGDYGSEIWKSSAYSIVNPLIGEVFATRKYGSVGYYDADNDETKDKIKKYYLDKITIRGWDASSNDELCSVYLPEAKILVNRQKGYLLQFLEGDHPIAATGAYIGDLVCVAILEYETSDKNTDQTY